MYSKPKICDDCLDPKTFLLFDKGQHVCQNCYGKRYNGKRFKSFRQEQREPNLKDLKRYLEKDW